MAAPPASIRAQQDAITRTQAVDVAMVMFGALNPEEQRDLYARIGQQLLLVHAVDESEMERHVRSLRRVGEEAGREPSVDDYRIISKRLIEAGEDVEPFKRLYAYFGGTWRLAREAYGLSFSSAPGRIEARFRARLLGKVACYSDETLRETLWHCAEDLGVRAPRVNQLERWRHRQQELADAAGVPAAQLPSATPYRRRWGTWPNALRACGFTSSDVDGRLEL